MRKARRTIPRTKALASSPRQSFFQTAPTVPRPSTSTSKKTRTQAKTASHSVRLSSLLRMTSWQVASPSLLPSWPSKPKRTWPLRNSTRCQLNHRWLFALCSEGKRKPLILTTSKGCRCASRSWRLQSCWRLSPVSRRFCPSRVRKSSRSSLRATQDCSETSKRTRKIKLWLLNQMKLFNLDSSKDAQLSETSTSPKRSLML